MPTDLHPEHIVCAYEDCSISIKDYETILEKFPRMRPVQVDPPQGGEVTLHEEWIALYTVEFIRLGDPSIKINIDLARDSVPMLSFYGYDDQERHISFIGYGLGGD